MEILPEIYSFIVNTFSSEGWANFGQGMGALLAGIAAISAFWVGKNSIQQFLMSESIKLKINDFREANRKAAVEAKSILDELKSLEEKVIPVSKNEIENYRDLLYRMNSACFGAVEPAQTL